MPASPLLLQQERGSKAKLCLQAEDENHLMQIESAAIREGLSIFLKGISCSCSTEALKCVVRWELYPMTRSCEPRKRLAAFNRKWQLIHALFKS